MLAREHAKAVHHFDGVMPHSFDCRPSSLYDSELKTTARHEMLNHTRAEHGREPVGKPMSEALEPWV
jgi:hypothetical protein